MPYHLRLSQARDERGGLQTSYDKSLGANDQGSDGEVRCEEVDHGQHFPLPRGGLGTSAVANPPKIHNTSETRALMTRLFDHQMANLAEFDCFSQVVFKSVDDYKQMKEDPWYKRHLVGDHEKFADTKKSTMTIGWISEFIKDGETVDGMRDCRGMEL